MFGGVISRQVISDVLAAVPSKQEAVELLLAMAEPARAPEPRQSTGKGFA